MDDNEKFMYAMLAGVPLDINKTKWNPCTGIVTLETQPCAVVDDGDGITVILRHPQLVTYGD